MKSISPLARALVELARRRLAALELLARDLPGMGGRLVLLERQLDALETILLSPEDAAAPAGTPELLPGPARAPSASR